MRNLLSHFLGDCVSFGPNARSSFVKKILNLGLKWGAVFWTGEGLGSNMAKNWRFRKSLIINSFRYLYKQWTCQSYAMRLSELCFEPLTCGKWAYQMPLMTRSKATNDTLRSHKWQNGRLKVKGEKGKSKYSLHNSFPDWTKKLTRFCKRNYTNYLRLRFLFFLPNCW